MTVSKRLRFEILKRDHNTCHYCGSGAPDVKMTVDHVVPVALGGSDDPTNLVAACADCNAGKSATPPTAESVEHVEQSAVRWKAAMELAAEQQAAKMLADQTARAEIEESFECAWTSRWIEKLMAKDTSTRFRHAGRWYAPQPADWSRSVHTMLAAGLTLDELLEAVRIAQTNSNVTWTEVWRYFCGVAWKTLRDRQNLARALLEAGEV